MIIFNIEKSCMILSAAAGGVSTTGDTAGVNDETLKSLQKHYMNAITSLNPGAVCQESTEKTSADCEDPEAKKVVKYFLHSIH